jgi:hypothetical protein
MVGRDPSLGILPTVEKTARTHFSGRNPGCLHPFILSKPILRGPMPGACPSCCLLVCRGGDIRQVSLRPACLLGQLCTWLLPPISTVFLGEKGTAEVVNF